MDTIIVFRGSGLALSSTRTAPTRAAKMQLRCIQPEQGDVIFA